MTYVHPAVMGTRWNKNSQSKVISTCALLRPCDFRENSWLNIHAWISDYEPSKFFFCNIVVSNPLIYLTKLSDNSWNMEIMCYYYIKVSVTCVQVVKELDPRSRGLGLNSCSVGHV